MAETHGMAQRHHKPVLQAERDAPPALLAQCDCRSPAVLVRSGGPCMTSCSGPDSAYAVLPQLPSSRSVPQAYGCNLLAAPLL
eukprot:1633260-Amphidinium_carterae.1